MLTMAGIFPKPYYAVIFISQKNTDDPAFDRMGALVAEKVASAKGFLGMDRHRTAGGLGFSISYWDSLENIRAWRDETVHAAGQKTAREKWYSAYTIRTCQVLSDSLFDKDDTL